MISVILCYMFVYFPSFETFMELEYIALSWVVFESHWPRGWNPLEGCPVPEHAHQWMLGTEID